MRVNPWQVAAIVAFCMAVWLVPAPHSDKSVYRPRPDVTPLAISAEVDRLLRAHAKMYRAGTLTPYSEFIDALSPELRASVPFRFMMAATREMNEASGFGRMPVDSHPLVVYLVFPKQGDPTRTDTELHRRVCERFLRDSGKTFEQLSDEFEV